VSEYVETTTASFRRRHYASTSDLHGHPDLPGLQGDSLCHVNNLGGVFDQVRADHWVEIVARGGVRNGINIADLPLCKRCARSAPASQEGGKQ
jgi:hypothetical protein